MAYPNATYFSHKAFVPGFRTGGLIAKVFRNPLISGLLHGFLGSRGLFVKIFLLLFGARRRVRDDAVKCKCAGTA